MTIDELEHLAATGAEMPDGLVYPEQHYYLTIRQVYAAAKDGRITRERGSQEKKKLLETYHKESAEMKRRKAEDDVCARQCRANNLTSGWRTKMAIALRDDDMAALKEAAKKVIETFDGIMEDDE